MNLMMAAIFNCVILNSTILESAILVFPLKHTHTCQDWFPPFAHKKLHSHFPPPPFEQKNSHSFILTQLDDGGHLKFGLLEFCHLGFSFCIVEFRHLVFFSQIYSKTLPLHSDFDSNYFNLTQTHSFSLNLMMVAIMNSAIVNCAILDSVSASWNSDTLYFSPRFTQKYSPSTMTLT